MKIFKRAAPAKINLTLHITGQRDDGYHLLDSLVVFANVADQLTARRGPAFDLTVSGPFAQGVPTDDSNLIMRAARMLAQVRNVRDGAAITLEKNLPHAAGIGSGSADAAATVKLLADLWGVPTLAPSTPEIVALGADVPVCMRSPAPARMSGIGDLLGPLPALPSCALVLVRPPVDVPTGAIFKALTNRTGTAMDPLPSDLNLDAMIDWLQAQRNDLAAPAIKIAPDIGKAIAKLNAMPAVRYAGMSGSGATCFGIVKDMGTARQVARTMQLSHMGWWVAPAEVLKPGAA
ncbi:4-(cytidine 5'-diphospho)-2-C-methyl-D-erythritol kinase [Yoonia sediminilitoris]|uniref:4-diphosphocytidyl-2-C-methyl-D-erythritol kinase n=1 Tax=Yoonia sediminilitoris TaxID=1286148 RepID=A0A2T6KIP1_9RHOB|nr:4-(cytidine 5'-diphospho)-2-C-methyl-D-erythritol kinase [Yoonia sediminilitoris]PUB15586.1 4-diphosphocytidyl-2-C-methyl-D-erythritol kinase [Yoonia sediminilitoris]RCW96195.1 4-diphosphocytidyl-2-C-methyl-D-erythritol kinase [Yoonia sediminilitoris]